MAVYPEFSSHAPADLGVREHVKSTPATYSACLCVAYSRDLMRACPYTQAVKFHPSNVYEGPEKGSKGVKWDVESGSGWNEGDSRKGEAQKSQGSWLGGLVRFCGVCGGRPHAHRYNPVSCVVL
jgi:hypothetical protein